MLRQAIVYIKGDVIGVGFRAWTKIHAKIIGIKGWVKNNFEREDIFGPRGGVEALIQTNEEDKMNQMLEKLKIGSPVSRVDDVEIYFEDPHEVFDSFEVIK